MEDQEVVCAAERCGCKAISYRVVGDEKEPLCIWHCYTQSDEYPLLFSKVHYVDIYAITEEDIRFIEKAQEVFQQVFAQKERSEKDLLNREVYKLISLYFSKIFNALLKIYISR